MERISNPPVAQDLMVTARSFGNYDLAAALADIIDNSINANASHVWIEFDIADDRLTVRIRDDGSGMSGAELQVAMRPASANPENRREPKDLGRFGWGLKSASLSQARVLTVVTWQPGTVAAARWDIDNIGGWGMDFAEGDSALCLLRQTPPSTSGTEVVWTNCDRLEAACGDTLKGADFTGVLAHARRHLSLIFHRFLDSQNFKIMINGRQLSPIDPFIRHHTATQTWDRERISMGASGEIFVKFYVLPHFSKLTMREQDSLGGPEGMVRNQGFYVYRNRRLIIWGTWFRLLPHGELSQLARVQVDLPNTLDAEWRITVDKSDAQLPPALRTRLKGVVARYKSKSGRVIRSKGASAPLPTTKPVWERVTKKGRIRYIINREHPMVSAFIDTAGSNATALLSLLESYFPLESFLRDAERRSDDLAQSPTDPKEFLKILDQTVVDYCVAVEQGDHTVDGFLDYVRTVEPFASQWALTESAIRDQAEKYFTG